MFKCFPDLLYSSLCLKDEGLYSNKLKYNYSFELKFCGFFSDIIEKKPLIEKYGEKIR